MENDQAARLRDMVRAARASESAAEGPRGLIIVSLDGMASAPDLAQFTRDLATAVTAEGVRLAGEGEIAEADWVYSLVVPPESKVDEAKLECASMVLALTETSPSAVLATYALLKQLHQHHTIAEIEVVFVSRAGDSERASEGLRGTCQRFLGWDAMGTWRWLPKSGPESLKELAERLAMQSTRPSRGNSLGRNSLARFPLEAV